ncbi:MAG: aromatic ring-hydroxylating oxygenase subunit alpha [Dehalococcoidia bacterium]
MSREQLMQMARREVENLNAGRIDLLDDVYKVPASAYIDQGRWEKEVDRIFKRLPLVAAFSSELREPGAYRALEIAGTPLLITRNDDGRAQAFVNMCSHRGAILKPADECGTAKGFRCPYHAWSYDLNGRLVSVFDQKNFGDIDRDAHGLTPLPTEERSGMIWVIVTPGAEVDFDAFLSGYDQLLDDLRFNETHVVGRQVLHGPNWKVAYDGYRDYYHLPILHRNSFGPDSPHQPDYYYWGPHARLTAPKRHEKLADTPEEQWVNSDLAAGVWTIFPNVSIAGGGANGNGYMVSQMFPGKTPLESYTIQNFIQFGDPADDDKEEIAQRMAFYHHVVLNEDYITGLGIQRALQTGARDHLLFGRNEGGGQMFHRWVEALINTEEAGVGDLLKRGIPVPFAGG